MSSTTTAGVRECVRVCAGVHGCVCVRGYARVCMGLHRGAQYGRLCIGVHWCAQVCVKVCGCLRVCAWDEFSEYLLENRVPTSADFNTYPIRIFLTKDTSISDLKQFDRV